MNTVSHKYICDDCRVEVRTARHVLVWEENIGECECGYYRVRKPWILNPTIVCIE